MDENLKAPAHVGLIMDGNGRWAKKRLLPRSAGHKAGMNAMISLAEHAQKRGVRYMTAYVLSTENLSGRPKDELDGIFKLLREYFVSNVKKLYKKNSRVKVIGDLSALPQDIISLLKDGEDNSPEGAEFTLIFAINYGGRADIVNAVNRAIEGGKKLDEKEFASLLYTADIPDPDLIIRTGGEIRTSNFLTWQAAYAELYFTDILFPDFSKSEFDKALQNFSARERRFGKI
ncbi:MAG: di-trans,poly-cis-decaprenylcistransferase [Clostridia bacterium]|nr:di-trans,poly-cis-decaprenylcistransferase [Clostridia bacterium]